METKIAPSILAADFSKMGEEVERLERCGADMIHVDMMDGNYVKTITFGTYMVRDIRKHTSLPIDVHLMVMHPENVIDDLSKFGATSVSIHYEICKENTDMMIREIHHRGMKACVVINPNTPIEVLKPYLPIVEMVLLMGVYPGYGGQRFIPETLGRARELKKMIEETGFDVDIEVDGGVTEGNIRALKDAGINVIVAGSAVFNSPDMAQTISTLKNA